MQISNNGNIFSHHETLVLERNMKRIITSSYFGLNIIKNRVKSISLKFEINARINS